MGAVILPVFRNPEQNPCRPVIHRRGDPSNHQIEQTQ